MGNLKYYLDLRHNVLLAYEASVEFFVMYLPETNEWTDCRIPFSNFRHDYDFREVSGEEAFGKTNGNLPEALLRQYLDLLNRNTGCPSETETKS